MPNPIDWKWSSAELERKLLKFEIRELRAAWASRNTPEGPKCRAKADAFRELRLIIVRGP